MQSIDSASPKFGEGDPLPKPERILYQKPLNSTWDSPLIHGFDNQGTNCYMNSVLQCLQCVPIWSNYLWNDHTNECHVDVNKCFACHLATVTFLTHYHGYKSVKPFQLCANLSTVSKKLRPNEQHDAHEFLICLFERMQENLTPRPVSPYLEMTTAVAKIFGGFLRSQIACQECLMTSNTYEPYFNISLDIENIDSMKTALNNFFEIDTFDNNPCYDCEKCQKQTRAAKRYTIETLPEVLIFQLKRYDKDRNKLSHKVKFTQSLNLEPYMSSNEICKNYRLYGVVSHLGDELKSGHYRSYVSHPASDQYNWHCVDDSNFWPLKWSNVASQEAYLLFYIKSDKAMVEEDEEEVEIIIDEEIDAPIDQATTEDDSTLIDLSNDDDVEMSDISNWSCQC